MQYDVLICDAPWKYNNKKTGGSHKSGAAQKYPTMDYMEIAELKNQLYYLMKKDSYLFFWTTNSMIKEALYILDDWNYNLRTILTWDKQRYGMGYWFRGQTEHCLFATRGHLPALKSTFRNLITEKSEKHSKKPLQFFNIVQTEFFDKKILELFATSEREQTNWTCIGNEISGNPIQTDLVKLLQMDTHERLEALPKVRVELNDAEKIQQYMKEHGDT